MADVESAEIYPPEYRAKSDTSKLVFRLSESWSGGSLLLQVLECEIRVTEQCHVLVPAQREKSVSSLVAEKKQG